MRKVGKGGRGRNEGYGKWVELADLPTLHLYKENAHSSKGGRRPAEVGQNKFG